MKLPNGFGSVTKMSGKRRRPYIVRKSVGWKYDEESDRMIQQFETIGYARTKKEGLEMLANYSANPQKPEESTATFAQIYEEFIRYKFGDDTSSISYLSYRTAFRKCEMLHDKLFVNIKRQEMQDVIDKCGLGYKSKTSIKTLFQQLSKFALMDDIIDKNYAQFLKVEGAAPERGEPFSEAALRAIWSVRESSVAQIALMMIYSGLRISELCSVHIDIENGILTGGMKTKASKSRIAPIHSATLHFWKDFDQASFSPVNYRNKAFYPLMEQIGFPEENGKRHTPHDCRHTFSWLADKYGIDEASKHLLMGHTLSGDVEQTVYRHRTIEQLREELEKIQVPI